MGKSKKTDYDTIRTLKSIIRNQQKEIASLKKELNKLEANIPEDEYEQEEHVQQRESIPPSCPKCGAAALETPIGKFTLQRCTRCTWRARK